MRFIKLGGGDPAVDQKESYETPCLQSRVIVRTGDHPFLDSWVVIESDKGGGGTAFGHCLVRGVPEVLGACRFTGGSGSLKGFKADVTVTTVDGTIWHWNGAVSSDD